MATHSTGQAKLQLTLSSQPQEAIFTSTMTKPGQSDLTAVNDKTKNFSHDCKKNAKMLKIELKLPQGQSYSKLQFTNSAMPWVWNTRKWKALLCIHFTEDTFQISDSTMMTQREYGLVPKILSFWTNKSHRKVVPKLVLTLSRRTCNTIYWNSNAHAFCSSLSFQQATTDVHMSNTSRVIADFVKTVAPNTLDQLELETSTLFLAMSD